MNIDDAVATVMDMVNKHPTCYFSDLKQGQTFCMRSGGKHVVISNPTYGYNAYCLESNTIKKIRPTQVVTVL